MMIFLPLKISFCLISGTSCRSMVPCSQPKWKLSGEYEVGKSFHEGRFSIQKFPHMSFIFYH